MHEQGYVFIIGSAFDSYQAFPKGLWYYRGESKGALNVPYRQMDYSITHQKGRHLVGSNKHYLEMGDNSSLKLQSHRTNSMIVEQAPDTSGR